MDEQALLANVMRKIIASREEFMGCYLDIQVSSMCIDGWVENLTPEEVRALRNVYEETRVVDV